MKIKVNLNYDIHNLTKKAKAKNDWGDTREFDSVRVREISGRRAYLIAIKDGMNMLTIAKMIEFKNGIMTVKFGKEKIEIGTYEQVA